MKSLKGLGSTLEGKREVDVLDISQVTEVLDEDVLHSTVDKVGKEDFGLDIVRGVREETALKIFGHKMRDDQRSCRGVVDEGEVPDITVDDLCDGLAVLQDLRLELLKVKGVRLLVPLCSGLSCCVHDGLRTCPEAPVIQTHDSPCVVTEELFPHLDGTDPRAVGDLVTFLGVVMMMLLLVHLRPCSSFSFLFCFCFRPAFFFFFFFSRHQHKDAATKERRP